MKRYKLLLVVFILISVSFNIAFIVNLIVGKTSQKFPTKRAKQLQSHFSLTEKQKDQMRPIQIQLHLENESIKQQIGFFQKKLLEEMRNESVNRKQINHYIEKINLLQKKIQINTIEEFLKIRQIMNAQQCNCLINQLGGQLDINLPPCKCTHCQSHKKGQK